MKIQYFLKKTFSLLRMGLLVKSFCIILVLSGSFSVAYGQRAPGDDFDNDGIINSLDADDDNDGILDINEVQTGSLSYEFYNNNANNNVENIPVGQPTRTGTVSNFDLTALADLVTPGDRDTFSVRYTGNISINTAATYTFFTTSDDGSRLFIDDILVVDNNGLHGVQDRSGMITLAAGLHTIRILFFENTGAEVLQVRYESAGIAKTTIPFEILSPAISRDIDNDGIPDYLDRDSDNDGCFDAVEGGDNVLLSQLNPNGSINYTANGGLTNGVPNLVNPGGAADTDGIQGQAVGASQNPADSTQCLLAVDSDKDGIADAFDFDDDNDGILDTVEGYCAARPILLKSQEYKAKGAGAVGKPIISFNAPTTGSGKRTVLLLIDVERDHTPSPFGDNWETATVPLVNKADMPTVNYGANNAMVKENFVFSFDAVEGSTAKEARLSRTQYVYSLSDANIAAGSQTISLANFINGTNAGDEFTARVLVYDNVRSIESVSGVLFNTTNNFPPTLPISGTALSPNQPAGSSQTDNVLLAFGGVTAENGLSVTNTWTTIFNNSNRNTAGTYAGTANVTPNTSENDGFTSAIATLTGVSGNQTITFSNYGTNAMLGTALMFRINGFACTLKDTDADGIPDYLDLDSDNDGCTDAIEGGDNVLNGQLVAAVAPLTVGSPSTAPNSNLGNTVDTNGVPTVVNSGGAADFDGFQGQGIGSAANRLINTCVCYNDANTATAGVNANHGVTLLQRAGADNGNWPMIRKGAFTALESNTKGFVITRVNGTTGISTPVEGMMVYDIDAKCLKLYDGTAWSCFATPTCP